MRDGLGLDIARVPVFARLPPDLAWKARQGNLEGNLEENLSTEIVSPQQALARSIRIRCAPIASRQLHISLRAILGSFPTDKDPMTRTDAIARAHAQFQSGDFLADLGRRV